LLKFFQDCAYLSAVVVVQDINAIDDGLALWRQTKLARHQYFFNGLYIFLVVAVAQLLRGIVLAVSNRIIILTSAVTCWQLKFVPVLDLRTVGMNWQSLERRLLIFIADVLFDDG
jgi:hypothetical protein